MLNQYYRFHIVNNSGQTVTYDTAGGRIVLHVQPFYINPSTGKIVYSGNSSIAVLTGGNTVANGGFIKTAEQDNSSDLFLGALVSVEVKHDEGAAAEGTFDIYYESHLQSGFLPSDHDGFSDPETNGLTSVGSLI